MGSKQRMLENGLGESLLGLAPKGRFVDLFAGSAAVSWFIAQRTDWPVVSVDLQRFSKVLSTAVVARTRPLVVNRVWSNWVNKALRWIDSHQAVDNAFRRALTNSLKLNKDAALLDRDLCRGLRQCPIARAYGGYYFSAYQAIAIDALRRNLPKSRHGSRAALGALVMAGSRCSASPGHTAQPFGTRGSSLKALLEARSKNIWDVTYLQLMLVSTQWARKPGRGVQGDAMRIAKKLVATDLFFVDPPYSSVHYSRFYHVLETIALGKCGKVSGTGRYPPPPERVKSGFSMYGDAAFAFERLILGLATTGASGVVTFPKDVASNGLSGELVEDICDTFFHVHRKVVNGRFSTLGGRAGDRSATIPAYEIILTLKPR